MKVRLMRAMAVAAAAAMVTVLAACGGGSDTATGGGQNGGTSDARIVVSVANSFEFLPAEFGLKLGVWNNRKLNVTNTYVSGGQYGQALMYCGSGKPASRNQPETSSTVCSWWYVGAYQS